MQYENSSATTVADESMAITLIFRNSSLRIIATFVVCEQLLRARSKQACRTVCFHKGEARLCARRFEADDASDFATDNGTITPLRPIFGKSEYLKSGALQ
jgi:hypothetical protein